MATIRLKITWCSSPQLMLGVLK